MAYCCGSRAITKKIMVRNEEIPIRGLEAVMFMVFNMNLDNEEKIVTRLRSEITELRNVIPIDKEEEFNNALFTEYKTFTKKIIINRGRKIL